MGKIRILHLSDIHLGKSLWKFNNNPDEKDRFNFNEYCSTLIDYIKTLETKPDFIIITGDLADSGYDKDSYDLLLSFLLKLCSQVSFDKERILIVPGNHDVNRIQSSIEHRLDKFQNFINKFYNNGSYIKINDDNNQIEKSKWEHQFSINDIKVTFVPLYSPLLNPEKLVPDKIRQVLSDELKGNNMNYIKWFEAFDRGLIEEYQLKKIFKIQNDMIGICLFHHNPLPLSRPKNEFSSNFFPEINLLSNGTEVIEDLSEKGFNIIFHGHRHQNSIIELNGKKIVIIGAPSLVKRDGFSESQKIGFNIVDIIDNKNSLEIIVNKHINSQRENGGIKIIEDRDGGNKFCIEKNSIKNNIITYKCGINELSKQILDSISGETILHYRPDAKWKTNYHGINYSPFELFLKCIIDNKALYEDFIESISPGKTVRQISNLKFIIKEKINNILTSVDNLKQSYKNKEALMEALMDVFNINFPTHDSKISFMRDGNDFVNKLKDSPNIIRQNLYAYETFKCLFDSNWHIHKSIYFPSNHSYHKEDPLTTTNLKDIIKKKFNWLLESLLEISLLPNYQISWLPYYIRGFSLKSIVAFNHDREHSIMIGFREHTDDSSGAVLNIDEKTNGDDGLLKDLKSLINKSIYPLVGFLIRNFPILRNQTIYLNNLKVIEAIFEIDESVLNEFIKNIEDIGEVKTEPSIDDYKKNQIDYDEYKKLLSNLYNWVLSEGDFSFGNKVIETHKDYWDKNEMEELITRLNNLKMKNEIAV